MATPNQVRGRGRGGRGSRGGRGGANGSRGRGQRREGPIQYVPRDSPVDDISLACFTRRNVLGRPPAEQLLREMSLELKRWVAELTPVLDKYDYDAIEVADIVRKCDMDPNRVQAAVNAILEERRGHEVGEWIEPRRRKSKQHNISPNLPPRSGAESSRQPRTNASRDYRQSEPAPRNSARVPQRTAAIKPTGQQNSESTFTRAPAGNPHPEQSAADTSRVSISEGPAPKEAGVAAKVSVAQSAVGRAPGSAGRGTWAKVVKPVDPGSSAPANAMERHVEGADMRQGDDRTLPTGDPVPSAAAASHHIPAGATAVTSTTTSSSTCNSSHEQAPGPPQAKQAPVGLQARMEASGQPRVIPSQRSIQAAPKLPPSPMPVSAPSPAMPPPSSPPISSTGGRPAPSGEFSHVVRGQPIPPTPAASQGPPESARRPAIGADADQDVLLPTQVQPRDVWLPPAVENRRLALEPVGLTFGSLDRPAEVKFGSADTELFSGGSAAQPAAPPGLADAPREPRAVENSAEAVERVRDGEGSAAEAVPTAPQRVPNTPMHEAPPHLQPHLGGSSNRNSEQYEKDSSLYTSAVYGAPAPHLEEPIHQQGAPRRHNYQHVGNQHRQQGRYRGGYRSQHYNGYEAYDRATYGSGSGRPNLRGYGQDMSMHHHPLPYPSAYPAAFSYGIGYATMDAANPAGAAVPHHSVDAVAGGYQRHLIGYDRQGGIYPYQPVEGTHVETPGQLPTQQQQHHPQHQQPQQQQQHQTQQAHQQQQRSGYGTNPRHQEGAGYAVYSQTPQRHSGEVMYLDGSAPSGRGYPTGSSTAAVTGPTGYGPANYLYDPSMHAYGASNSLLSYPRSAAETVYGQGLYRYGGHASQPGAAAPMSRPF